MRPTYRDEPCRTALNRVRNMTFKWSLNPYMGCAHQCTFCFVRAFEKVADRPSDARYGTSIRVKTNLVEVLRRELARKTWKREQVVVGTATDPYQPAEGRFRLTRGAIQALGGRAHAVRDHHARPADRPRRRRPGRGRATAKVGVTFSIPTLDPEIWRRTEPGTAPPRQRLRAIRTLIDAGIDASVGMAPILPGLSDDPAQDGRRHPRGARRRRHLGLGKRPVPATRDARALPREPGPRLAGARCRCTSACTGPGVRGEGGRGPVRRQVRELASSHGIADRRARHVPRPEPLAEHCRSARFGQLTLFTALAATPRRGQRGARGAERGSASQSARTGEKMSTTMAPSGPATASCGRLDGIRHVPPGPSERRSPSMVNVIVPSMHIPSCSCSWRCSGTIAPGPSSTSARLALFPTMTRAWTVSPQTSSAGTSPMSRRFASAMMPTA